MVHGIHRVFVFSLGVLHRGWLDSLLRELSDPDARFESTASKEVQESAVSILILIVTMMRRMVMRIGMQTYIYICIHRHRYTCLCIHRYYPSMYPSEIYLSIDKHTYIYIDTYVYDGSVPFPSARPPTPAAPGASSRGGTAAFAPRGRVGSRCA